MNIVIAGFDREGKSSYEYYKQLGHTVSIADAKADLEVPQDAANILLGASYLDSLSSFDLVIRTPGLRPQKLIDKGVDPSKIWSGTNEFLRVCPTKNIIGVTGTKGKGTTSTLITKMLESMGHKVHLGGNIGLPALELLKQSIQPNDWVVLELSSFQLIDVQFSPHIGVCLMVVPEHLDWHADMAEYIGAKQKLFLHQTHNDIAIYFANNDTSSQIASVSEGKKIPYYTPPNACVVDGSISIDGTTICTTNEVALLGEHNWQNICAAITAVWQVEKNVDAIASVIKSFSGLEHRLEFVKEVDGVKYYNDSFATTPEATIAAMRAFAQPKVMILGGSDKGVSMDGVVQEVLQSNITHVIAIGVTGSVIAQKLKAQGYTTITEGLTTMQEIIAAARANAKNGDVVLLSTASASFGLFKDYKDRGNQFRQTVQQL